MEGYSFSLVQLPLRNRTKVSRNRTSWSRAGAQPGAHQPQAHGVAQQPAGAGPDEGDADKGHQGGELGIPRAPQAAKLYHLFNLHEQHHAEDAHDHGAIVQNDGVVGIEQENLLAKEEVDKAHDAGAHQAQALAHAAVDFRHIRRLRPRLWPMRVMAATERPSPKEKDMLIMLNPFFQEIPTFGMKLVSY